MSHYSNNNNNNAANSWQSRPNNASSASSLFGQHDLGVNPYNVNNNNSASLNNPPSNSTYNPAAANLLAQFAVNGVNFSNLAANLPAIINNNVLGSTPGIANPNQAYQWHASSQQQSQSNIAGPNNRNNNIHIETSTQQNLNLNSNSSAPSNNSNKSLNKSVVSGSGNNSSSMTSSSRISDQRIVSISNTSSNNNSNSSSNSYNNNNNNKSNSLNNSISDRNHNNRNNNDRSNNDYKDRKSLGNMNSHNNNNMNNTPSRYNQNHINSSSNKSLPHSYNNNKNNGPNNNNNRMNDRNPRDNRQDTRSIDRSDRSDTRIDNRNNNNNNNNSRDNQSSHRDAPHQHQRSTSSNNNERDRRDNHRANNNTNSNNTSKPAPELTSALAATTNLAVANPLAQALLTQLAATSTGTANSQALVAALAAVNASVSNPVAPATATAAVAKPNDNKYPNSNRRRSRSPSNTHQTSNKRSWSRNKSPNKTTHHSRSPSRSQSIRNETQTVSKRFTTTSSSIVPTSKPSRYSIKLPKYQLDSLSCNVSGVKARYNQLYIPSDFINVNNSWQRSLPIDRSLKFNNRCLFHLMKKEAQPVIENKAIYDAPDADHTWTVKVMLLAMPSITELHKRTSLFAEDTNKSERLEHPAKVIQFLVGNKGKHELMALGGAWSPSLDGPNPAKNTQTLINTAVRTVKALTGIDLSSCTQWLRFLDIQYNRNEDYKTVVTKSESDATESMDTSSSFSTTKAKLELDDHDDIETTVMFLPNVWSLMPTTNEYNKLVEEYKNFVENPPAPEAELTPVVNTVINSESEAISATSSASKPTSEPTEEPASSQEKANPSSQLQEQADEAIADDPIESENTIETMTKSLKDDYAAKQKSLQNNDDTKSDLKEANDSTDLADYDENDDSESKLEPTHWAELDLKKMKVDELRHELMARDLDTRGLKSRLVTRLQEALDTEKVKEEEKKEAEENNEEEAKVKEEEAEKVDDKSNGAAATPGVDDDGNEISDVIYTHVNDEFESESFQIDDAATKAETDAAIELNKEKNKKEQETASRLARIAKAERERLYKIPATPHIIVHASKTAKNGRFDCQLVSLSHLLDYRRDDNKESSFEVSLFAEHFNEMLIRDHGFIIYKHLLSIRSSKERELLAAVASNKRKLPTQETPKDDDDSKRLKTTNTNNETVEQDQDTKMEISTPSAPPPPPAVSVAESTTKTIQLTKPKPSTVYKELLLSFNYFDASRTNYIIDKDLEDLLLCIGLSLSRSKIKALLSKLSFKDGLLNYRTLTDKTPKEVLADTEALQGLQLPDDSEIVASKITYDSYMHKLNPCDGQEAFNKETGVFELNGTTINVLNTLKNLDHSEKVVNKLEQKLKEALEEIDRLKTVNKTNERTKSRLNDDVAESKKKLRDQIRTNKEIDDKYIRYKDLLQRSRSTINKLSDEISDTLKRDKPQREASIVNGVHNKKSAELTKTTSLTSLQVEGNKTQQVTSPNKEDKKVASSTSETDKTSEQDTQVTESESIEATTAE